MRPVLFLLLLSAAPALTPEAAAQVRRCVDARGNAVYTDRACDAVDASPAQSPVAQSGAYASGFAIRGCARTPDQLLDGVRGALESRDVNRLANFYHWTGTGTGSAKSLMDSLEAIAARPLVNAQLVYPYTLPEYGDDNGVATRLTPLAPLSNAAPGQAGADREAWRERMLPQPADEGIAASASDPAPRSNDNNTGTDGDDAPQPWDDASQASAEAGLPRPETTRTTPAGPPPESLLVEQMSGAADAGSAQVRFSLRRNAGCWWIQL